MLKLKLSKLILIIISLWTITDAYATNSSDCDDALRAADETIVACDEALDKADETIVARDNVIEVQKELIKFQNDEIEAKDEQIEKTDSLSTWLHVAFFILGFAVGIPVNF
jgi:hypothetical protein